MSHLAPDSVVSQQANGAWHRFHIPVDHCSEDTCMLRICRYRSLTSSTIVLQVIRLHHKNDRWPSCRGTSFCMSRFRVQYIRRWGNDGHSYIIVDVLTGSALAVCEVCEIPGYKCAVSAAWHTVNLYFKQLHIYNRGSFKLHKQAWLMHLKITNRQSALEAGQSQTDVLCWWR